MHTIRAAPMNSFSDFYQMSPEELHTSMVHHYPNIRIDGDVTLVKFLSPEETSRLHGAPCASWKYQTLELVYSLFDPPFKGNKLNTKRFEEPMVSQGYLILQASNDKNLKALVWVHEIIKDIRLKDIPTQIPEDQGRDLGEILHRIHV